MTKPHKDRIIKDSKDNGYSIRVGSRVPKNSANLAYVSTPKVSPKNNLFITDLTHRIKENNIDNAHTTEKIVYPDESFMLRELDGDHLFPSPDITITDEFSIPETRQEKPEPLYYQAEVQGRFDASNASVMEYLGGYVDTPIRKPKTYEEINRSINKELLYLGSKIKITKGNGSPLDASKKYKVKLVEEKGEGIPRDTYRIIIYSNFRCTENETYLIRYEKYGSDGSHDGDYTEVLNAYPFFKQEDPELLKEWASSKKLSDEWRAELQNKSYAVEEDKRGDYKVYAPSQIIYADKNDARPPDVFQYRVKAKLKAKLSGSNPGKINIGIAHLNESVAGKEELTALVKKLYENNFKAPYLDFQNPHPPEGYNDKESADYWTVDLRSYINQIKDYDLIILTGYGVVDMTDYSDVVRQYLENGGRIWIDNADNGTSRLQLKNFCVNIGFSSEQVADDVKTKTFNFTERNEEYTGRLYRMPPEDSNVGYENINPKIIYNQGESPQNWTTLVQYADGSSSVMYRDAYNEGIVFVSNCSISKAIMYNNIPATKMFMNILLSLAENKRFVTPWLKDHTHSKDNLFKEEYRIKGRSLYIDSRSDDNSKQIVAKKIISKTVRDALIPYMDPAYYTAKGTFSIDVSSDEHKETDNGDFEAGSATNHWINTTNNAIPGWNVVVNGDGYAEHVSDVVQRGTKAIRIAAPGTSNPSSQIFWDTAKKITEPGSYRVEAWVKTLNLQGDTTAGASIAIYDAASANFKNISQKISGTQDWQKISVTFAVTKEEDVEIRVGITDGKAWGTVWCDDVALYRLGDVSMTPDNDGSKTLYAYTLAKRSNGFNFSAEGFNRGDITNADKSMEAILVITPFVYSWDNVKKAYGRINGNPMLKNFSVRKSEGLKNLGLVANLLPELPQGTDWADKDRVFYEMSITSPSEENDDAMYINGGFFDTRSGRYVFSQSSGSVISHSTIFDTNDSKSEDRFIVQVSTSYYTVRATKRRYAIQINNRDRIYLGYPSTIDERDGWYLRIKNGRFIMREVDYYKYTRYYRGRSYFSYMPLWEHYSYSIPEYNEQVFSPSKGIKKKREELCEYVNERTVRVQNSPIVVKNKIVKGELTQKVSDHEYQDGSSRYYKIDANNLLERTAVRVYTDNGGDNFTEVFSGFDVDYKHGMVIFNVGTNTNVKVDYECENLEVFRRRYRNQESVREQLSPDGSDGKTFVAKNINWLTFPSPKIYKSIDGLASPQIIPIDTYDIDYDKGIVTFKEEQSSVILADYKYSTHDKLTVRDFDAQTGLIYLKEPITFKDEVFANYYYEEEFLEYRGYYDEEANQFVKLDLNPTEGHYCTMRTVKWDYLKGKQIILQDVPTKKLLNKEVFVYMLPRKQGDKVVNDTTIKHCYSSREWHQIQQANSSAILLGKVHIREHASVEDVVVMDARKRGGGLKEKITHQEIERRSPNSDSYWDVGPFDGIAYYTNGVVMIELPKSILKREGGQFTEKEVNDIVRKYIAYGIYFNIEYV